MTSPQDPVDTEEPLIDRHDQGSEVATTLGGPEARGTAESMDNAAKETIDEPERAEDEDLSKQAPTPSAGSLSWAQTAAKVKDPLPVRDNEQVKEDQRIAVERTLRTEIDRLRNDLTVTEQRLTEEQARRKDESRHSARQVGDLSYRFNQCKADLNSKNGRIRQLEQENRNLETENQKLQKTQREEENKSTQLESKNKGLQEQVKNLSRDIAAQGSGDGQIADSELEKRVKQIVCDVQDWAMNGFRKSKPVLELSMASMLTVNTLKETMPNYQSRPEDRPKVKTLQVMVARLLLNIFNDPAVLCDARLTALKHVEAGLGVLAQTQPEVYNEWRALTYRLAYTADDESFGRAAASACDSITDRINKIVGDLFEPGTTPSYNKKLRKIVDAALRLARDLRMQRAVYAFQFIYSGEFDSASMADENGYEDSELDGRQIDIAVCPSLHKWGDQKGANMHRHTVVFKSRVAVVPENGD